MTTQMQKIVYFDKETIGNILEQLHGGSFSNVSSVDKAKAISAQGKTDASASVRLPVPLIARIRFVFTSRLSASYTKKTSTLTTVTSTDVSQFKEIRDDLRAFKNCSLSDIKNSLTSFRMAVGYANALRDGVDGLNTRELANLLNETEGYNLYDIGESRYVRFNSSAFISNYKYNDIVNSKLDLYCIKVGSFKHEDFDFTRRMKRMQDLFDSSADGGQTIGDVYPPGESSNLYVRVRPGDTSDVDDITLYDVVCAYISVGAS